MNEGRTPTSSSSSSSESESAATAADENEVEDQGVEGNRGKDFLLSHSPSSILSVSFESQQPLVSIPLRPLVTLSAPYPCVFRWVRVVPRRGAANNKKTPHSSPNASYIPPPPSMEYVISHSATYTPTLEDEGYELRFQCVVIKDARGEGMQVVFKRVQGLPHPMPKRLWKEHLPPMVGEMRQGNGASLEGLETDSSGGYHYRPSLTKAHSKMHSADSYQWRTSTVDKTFVIAAYNMMGNYWRLQENELDAALSTYSPKDASSISKKIVKRKNRALKHELFHQERIIKALKRRFSRCSTHIFTQAYRKKMMLRELLSCHSDLYCLHNVNLEEYKYWNVELSKLGYSACIEDHTGEGNNHVGICLMYRRSKFNKSFQCTVRFSEIKRLKSYDEAWKEIIPQVKSYCMSKNITLQQLDFGGRCAIIQEFDLRDLYLMRTNLQDDTDEKLVVANVELYVPDNKSREQQEMMQVIQLFIVLQTLHYIWRDRYKQRDNVAFVLACDLGSDCNSAAYKYVTQNLLLPTIPSLDSTIAASDVSFVNSIDEDDTASSHEYTPAVHVSGPLSDSSEDGPHGHEDDEHNSGHHDVHTHGDEGEDSLPRLSLGDSTCGSPDNYKVNVSPSHKSKHEYGVTDLDDSNMMDIDILCTTPEKQQPVSQHSGILRRRMGAGHSSQSGKPTPSIRATSNRTRANGVAPLLDSPFPEGFTSAYQAVLHKEPLFPQADQNTTQLPTTTFIFFNNLAVRRVSSLLPDSIFPNQFTTSNRCFELADLAFLERLSDTEDEAEGDKR